MKPDARMLVIGAGVNGSVCAAALHRAGYGVTVLARARRLEELQKGGGIEIEDPLKGTRTVTQVPVVDDLAPEDIYEYILVIVRKNQVRDLLPVLAQNQSPSVVFMVNTASGPEEWIAALGEGRVMLGFVFAGGRREGSLIRAMRGRHLTPIGEANGAITKRVTRLVSILNDAGLKAKAISDMPDWLATHGSMVAPVGMLILKHGCDTYALARSREDMGRLVDALRETLAVLRANGRRIVPRAAVLVELLPRIVVMRFFRALLSSRYGEIGAGWHCSQAPDEMHQLARELRDLMEQSRLPAPVLHQLLAAV